MGERKNKPTDPLYGRRFLLLIHGLVYTIGWATAFYLMVFSPSRLDQTWIAIITMMIWTPLLLVHTAYHFRSAGHIEAASNERDAYRQGFQDGVRYAADNTYETSQLDMDDGALVAFPSGGKQKRRER